MRILLVEDNARIGDFLVRGLSEEGHAVERVTTVRAARDAVIAAEHDILLVDRMLPDGDGLEFIRSLRAAGDARPAIVITARDRVEDRVEGLYGGADDYLVKPFAFEELLARIAALARRTSGPSPRIEIGPLTVDLERSRVFAGGTEIELTAQEFALLRFLAEHEGRVVSRTRILEAVWGLLRDPGSNVVDVYVRYVRNKLASAGLPPLIHTVRGRGYLLESREVDA